MRINRYIATDTCRWAEWLAACEPWKGRSFDRSVAVSLETIDRSIDLAVAIFGAFGRHAFNAIPRRSKLIEQKQQIHS